MFMREAIKLHAKFSLCWLVSVCLALAACWWEQVRITSENERIFPWFAVSSMLTSLCCTNDIYVTNIYCKPACNAEACACNL